MASSSLRAASFALLVAAGLTLPAAAPATEYIVDRDDDADVGACTAAADDCTLRGAITASNGDPDPDNDTIRIDGRHVVLAAALPVATKALTVAGDGAGSAIIDADGASPTGIAGAASSLLTLRDLRVTGADASVNYSAAVQIYRGSLERVAVVDNQTIGVAIGAGGAWIGDSVIARNRGFLVGGVFNNGAFSVLRGSTVTDNTARYAERSPEIPMSGGVMNMAYLTLEHATVAGNHVPADVTPVGGVDLGSVDAFGPMVRMRSSIVAGPAPACGGQVKSFGHNVVSDGSCRLDGEGDRESADPRLGAATADGLLPLLEGSPAIDVGGVCAKPLGGACDAGALESPFTAPAIVPDAPPPPSPAPSPAPAAVPAAADTTAPTVKLGARRAGRRVRVTDHRGRAGHRLRRPAGGRQAARHRGLVRARDDAAPPPPRAPATARGAWSG